MKTIIAILYAHLVKRQNKKWIDNPIKWQTNTFKKLIKNGIKTEFGNNHDFENIKSYDQYKEKVPVRDYEELRPYIEKVVNGEKDILWPGKPLYFAKTSGTTSGAKYIPITKESIKTHIRSARDALLNYFLKTKNFKPLNGKHMFLQGSPELDKKQGIYHGRLSGISAHYVPKLFLRNRKPSWTTNCIEDWEEKVEAVIQETVGEKMTIIAGIPSWVQMYFEKIQQKTNQPISDVFPDFSLMIHGGVNFKPYKKRFEELIGKTIPSIETYPASEGFIAYQDKQSEEGLLLCVNHGIFFEFIESALFFDDAPKRLSLKDVELGKDYVVILNTNAGLWGYNIGDTVRFVSISPYKIIVTGRIKHFTSAFGEHVIGKEVERAIFDASEEHQVVINEFHVAPQVSPSAGLPFHEWFIEFKTFPQDMAAFAKKLNDSMCSQNTYYEDLIKGNVLCPLKIRCVQLGGFNKMMKDRGKLGGQNKPPRLSNDRLLADTLTPYLND